VSARVATRYQPAAGPVSRAKRNSSPGWASKEWIASAVLAARARNRSSADWRVKKPAARNSAAKKVMMPCRLASSTEAGMPTSFRRVAASSR
jgi:hypothetical protein